jgi:hypothetical protein
MIEKINASNPSVFGYAVRIVRHADDGHVSDVWERDWHASVDFDTAAAETMAVTQGCILVEDLDDDDYSGDLEWAEDMDGDHGSALASAGFGTDEDYGYYGDE